MFFAGAEQPSHRNLLADCGVTRFAINLSNINNLVPNVTSTAWSLPDHLPDGAKWIAYADKDTTWQQAEPWVAQGPSLVIGPLEWAERMPMGSFAPWWTPEMAPGSHPVVGLTDDTIKAVVSLRRIMADFSGSVLAGVTGTSRGVERLDVLVSAAWYYPQRYGETQIWAGNKLHRYAGNRKHEVRPRHRMDIERLGIDYERIEADDPVETARLAIISWQHWEERHTQPGNVVALTTAAKGGLSSHPSYSDQDGPGSSHRRLALAPRRTGHAEREQVVLPGFTIETNEKSTWDEEGKETVERSSTVATEETSYRRCDTCYLAANCPAFQPGSMCAFRMPVEVRTKDQVASVLQATVEMQMQRVAFARFAEQLDGQGIDGSLSNEIDRLFNIMGKMKDVLDSSDVFRLELQAKGNAGMLSRIFGSSVGTAARALPIPTTSDEILHSLDD